MKKIKAMIKGKSKTVNFNALVAAVVTILAAVDYHPSVETVTAVTVIGNLILRYVTSKPLDEK